MNESVYIIFGIKSFVVLGATIALTVKAYKSRERGKKVLSALHVFTLGVFLSTVLVFVPVYYVGYDFGDQFAFFRPILMSIHNAFRVFILDGEFDTIRDAVLELGEPHHVLFSLYAAIIYVLAPVLTFGNVLSLFKSIKNELRFIWHQKRPFYIFSELNEKSIALAESIVENRDIKMPIIVFTDAFEKDDEENYELFLKACDLNAILLKKDITRLNVKRKKAHVEFFLIGDDESENVEQTIKLIQEYKNECQNRSISIYLYSNKQSAGYILDSIDKGNSTLDKSLVSSIQDDPKFFLTEKLYSSKTIDSGFYIRRIDNVELLVQQTLSDSKVVNTLFEDNKDKTISITILGMGSYGKEFLKQSLWLYQVLGYKVEINVFDAPSAENGVKKELIKKLGHEWPEIIDDPNKKSFIRQAYGDSNYDIHFFDGVDCFSTDFDCLFEPDSIYHQRLSKTQLAVVSLGDDDKDIDAAVMLRSLFDRIHSVGNKNLPARPKPLILSVVFDDKKSSNLNCNQENGGIVNYQGESMQIDFIGNLRAQFSYCNIKKQKELEDKALKYHLDWLRRDAFKMNIESQKDLDELADTIKKKTKAYMDYEYFRKSSIARVAHDEMLESAKKHVELHRAEGHEANCLCSVCARASITEHMRWNVYMRTIGYRYSEIRGDRAKTHNDLKSWGDLSEAEKYKDAF